MEIERVYYKITYRSIEGIVSDYITATSKHDAEIKFWVQPHGAVVVISIKKVS
jgi:hypothetical protein